MKSYLLLLTRMVAALRPRVLKAEASFFLRLDATQLHLRLPSLTWKLVPIEHFWQALSLLRTTVSFFCIFL
jgi:hypothetical protein